MFHPKDVRGRMSRRALLERGAGLAVTGSFLAACANTTDVKSTAGAGTQAGEVVTSGTGTAAAVPLGPGGIPIASRDRPVKLPLYDDNAGIDSKPAARGRPAQGLQLGSVHRPRGRQEVREAVQAEGHPHHVPERGRGDGEAAVGQRRLRRLLPERDAPADPGLAQARPAAQPRLPAQPGGERLARAGRSVLRQGRAVRRPLHRVRHRHRLAQRPGQGGHHRSCRTRGRRCGTSAAPTRARWRSSTIRATRSGWRCSGTARPTSTPRTR